MKPTLPSAITLSRAEAIARGTLTERDVMAAFFARRSPRTVEAYRGDLHLFAKWCDVEPGNELAKFIFGLGPGKANALLMEWSNEMQQTCAPHTVNRRLSTVRSLVKLGRMLGIVTWTLDVEGVKSARNVRDMRGPEAAGIERLFRATRTAFDRAALHLLYTRGLRSIEVRELKMEHLLLERSEVLVRGKGKTGLAPVTLGKATVEALRDWLYVRGDAPGYVFFKRSASKPVSRQHFWRLICAAGKRCGVKVRPHGLRHSAITAVLDATKGDVRKAQKFSRHASPTVLMRYDDARADHGGELARLLDNSLPPEKPK